MIPLWISLIKYVIFISIILLIVAYLTFFERKILAYLQHRLGPNRAGPGGWLQPIVDAVKLLTKEDFKPPKGQGFLHTLAPFLLMVPSLLVFSMIPIGGEFTFWGILKEPITLYVTDVNVAVLLILAFASMGIYGLILGGWASNSKYALLGALRSAAQMVSYEVPQGFAVVSVLILGGSLSLVQIVEAQKEAGVWFIFPGLLAFFVYFVCAIAETNRNPFDLPEAESELVAGYHTEYSGMKFGFFFMAEYANMILVSSLAVLFFFGGWLPPFPSLTVGTFIDIPFLWFFLKLAILLFFFIWFRGTFPRYRFDQLMGLGWKWLLPLSLINLLLMGVIKLWLW